MILGCHVILKGGGGIKIDLLTTRDFVNNSRFQLEEWVGKKVSFIHIILSLSTWAKHNLEKNWPISFLEVVIKMKRFFDVG